MTPDRLANLRALAEAATPGPWTVQDHADDDGDDAPRIVAPDSQEPENPWFVAEACACCGPGDATPANARYIAAVSPDVVMGLLDALAEAEASRLAAENANLRAMLDGVTK